MSDKYTTCQIVYVHEKWSDSIVKAVIMEKNI